MNMLIFALCHLVCICIIFLICSSNYYKEKYTDYTGVTKFYLLLILTPLSELLVGLIILLLILRLLAVLTN